MAEGAERMATLDETELPRLDVDGDDFRADANAALRAARQRGPFAISRRGIEVLAHADVLSLLSDPRLRTQDADVYRQYGAGERLLAFASEGLLSSMQDEKHTRIRRVFTSAFRIRHIESQRPMIRATAAALADHLPTEGVVDFVDAFSKPFPMEVLCRLLGIPLDDMGEFTAAATQLHLLAQTPLAPGFPAVEVALGELWDYCLDLVRLRRRVPANDTISALIEAQETEGRITDEELVWNLANLIFAGQDTTRYQLASALRAVVSAPGLWKTLREDATMVPSAAEEALRYTPVVNFVVRIPVEDFEFGGVRMAAGRRVILNFQAASRDPSRFDEPDAFTPRPPGRHPESFDVPFGYGMHFCVGAALARAEMQEALGVLVQRLSSVRLAGDPQMTHPAAMLHGPETLPIEFVTG